MDIKYLANRIQCSKEDKIECISTIKDIIDLANIARREGLLALENVVQNNNYPILLKKLITLIIDGTDPEIVQKVSDAYMISGNYNGKECLKNILIIEGCLMIQQGVNPTLIIKILLEYLGNEFSKDEEKIYQNICNNLTQFNKLF